jgi:hypothetical protein
MLIDTIFVVNSVIPKTASIYEVLKVTTPAIAALIVGLLSYFGAARTSKKQIETSLAIAKEQMFGNIILNSKNKWKDDLMVSISNLLTE